MGIVQQVTARNRIADSFMFAVNVIIGWFMMLVAMTYSVELFVCAVIGLLVGNFLFADRDNTQILGSPCCNAVNDKSTKPAHRHAVIEVTGMTCSGCSKTVEGAVMGIPGVITCSVSVTDGKAVIKFREPATAMALVEAIEAVGFDATSQSTNESGTKPPTILARRPPGKL